ncbi:DUF4817 domain-containing protein [Trichonephila clavipes]|uniref:DUF4817 domain-containing protein n=1 Tax=Trichonephila clavipes TaxID=2585209 RepID=A0A8X7BE58_TRICX|nr:DUF4817 domain-containing protein [Trichonephila clavipes]
MVHARFYCGITKTARKSTHQQRCRPHTAGRGTVEQIPRAFPGYRLLRRQSSQTGHRQSRRGLRKQDSSYGCRGRNLGWRGQASMPANLPDHPVQSIALDMLYLMHFAQSALKCAGAPSCWNHIRAFMLAGTLCSRTLHPYIQVPLKIVSLADLCRFKLNSHQGCQRLANQRLHLGRNEVSDWLDTRRFCRRDETILVSHRSGHIRALRHEERLKVYPPCPNCNVTQAAPDHILACIGCHKSQLCSSPSTGLHCLKTHGCQVIYSQFGLAIHQNDHQARRRFVEWAQNEIAVVPDFHKRILFIDEAHFWLNGYVNKQNCRIGSEANPQVYVETPLHPEKLTVWCSLWAGGIIGPYFFKNDEGHNVTVNGDRYRAMITNFFIPELNNHDVQELWFQQDGATCHTARATIDLLKDTFGDRLISRFGPVNWPPRSCDLTPLDYFLWGYVKSLVYADKPQTLDHLEDNIRRVIADIRPQMLEKVIENWTSRLDYIRANRGSHMPEIIFKM